MRFRVLSAVWFSAVAAAAHITPLGFIENRGQAPTGVRYLLRGSLHVQTTGFTLYPDPVTVEFAGASATTMSPADTLPGVVNIVSGSDPARWITGLRSYREIRIRGIYPDIDLTYRDATGSRLLVRRDSIGGELAAAADGGVYLLSFDGYGPRTVANPGGSLTSSCGGAFVAKLDANGVVENASVLPEVSRVQASGNKLVTWNAQGVEVLSQLPAQRQWISCTLHSGSLQRAPMVAPGEIITLAGGGLGPQNGMSFALDAQGRVPRELGGTRVLVNGVAMPVLYAQNGQVNAIVPFGDLTGPAVMEVEYGGLRSRFDASFVSSSPNLFTLSGSGAGQAAALNQDGTVNGPSNPARPGSIVSLFMTGTGNMSPAVREGEVARSIEPRPVTDWQIFFPVGMELPIEYAGPSPGLLTSVTQVNVRIPLTPPPLDTYYNYDSLPIIVMRNGQIILYQGSVAVRY